MPTFHSRMEQEDFILILKSLDHLFPIHAVFIGLKYQSLASTSDWAMFICCPNELCSDVKVVYLDVNECRYVFQQFRWIFASVGHMSQIQAPVGYQSWENKALHMNESFSIFTVKHFRSYSQGGQLHTCVLTNSSCTIEEKSDNSLLSSAESQDHSPQCVVLLLMNLAEATWGNVDCQNKILPHVVCTPGVQMLLVEKGKTYDNSTISNLTQCEGNSTMMRYFDKHFCLKFVWEANKRNTHRGLHTDTDHIKWVIKTAFAATCIAEITYRVGDMLYMFKADDISNLFGKQTHQGEHVVRNGHTRYLCATKPTEKITSQNILITYPRNTKFTHPLFTSRIFIANCPLGPKGCAKRILVTANPKARFYHPKDICHLEHSKSDMFYNNQSLVCTCNTTEKLSPLFYWNSTSNNCETFYSSQVVGNELFSKNCWESNYFDCQRGELECFHFSDICIYRVSKGGVITPCSKGSHLEQCDEFFCTEQFFKCVVSHCVPWAYVSDGKWDCPLGDDEFFTGAESTLCSAKLRCSVSKLHIHCEHFQSVCDGYTDCPEGEDEIWCVLKNIFCPKQCICVNLAVLCRNVSSTALMKGPNLDMFISYSLVQGQVEHFTNFSEIFSSQTVIVPGGSVRVLNFSQNVISEVCSFPVFKLTQLHLLDLSFNAAKKVQKFCFNRNLKDLQQIIFSGNHISFIDSYGFYSLVQLGKLCLQNNKLSNLLSRTFASLPVLQHLNLMNNSINHVEKYFIFECGRISVLNLKENMLSQFAFHIFELISLEYIDTNNPTVCCAVSPSTACNSTADPHLSCECLLPTTATKVTAYVASFCVFVLNTVSLCLNFVRQKAHQVHGTLRKTKSLAGPCNMILCMVNLMDLHSGVFLPLLWSNDAYYWNNIIFRRKEWIKSLGCSSAFAFLLISSFLLPVFLSLLSVARFMVVKYPMESKFKSGKFVSKLLLAIYLTGTSLVISASVAFIVLVEVQSTLCLPFVAQFGVSLAVQLVTLATFVWQLLALITIIMYSILLILVLKQSEKTANKSRVTPKLMLQIFTLNGVDIVSWVGAGVIFITALYLDSYPQKLTVWCTLTVLPLVAFVDPVIFVAVMKHSA